MYNHVCMCVYIYIYIYTHTHGAAQTSGGTVFHLQLPTPDSHRAVSQISDKHLTIVPHIDHRTR